MWRSASEGPKRIVPDGCVDLVIGDGAAFVAGPDTTAWSSVTRPDAVLSGVRFRPGRAAAALGVAADELVDRRVPVGELWGRSWAERLVEAEVSPVEAVAGRLGELPPEDLAVAELIARLEAGVSRVGEAAMGLIGSREAAAAGMAARASPEHNSSPPARTPREPGPGPTTPPHSPSPAEKRHPPSLPPRSAGSSTETGLSRAAAVVAWAEDPVLSAAVSERRLRRRFVQAVGYGPATYLRVSRFQRAVALAPHVRGLAALAAAAGYADQAHLSRDCRALTGLTPRRYFGGSSTVDVAVRDRLRSA
ncbi:helix-turn-helix domain-containing protein [Amycolatopsis sp. CA-126428]|uniref:helix-turn-helix domain-containing protein n=1 Tax=Amycolatopsis sp. CA-126428 TaxID=2073158 RepID=UPI000CD24713|nr:helix-turn-helix domain-containing protein [Amycolatopsis sp. CA-126428]